MLRAGHVIFLCALALLCVGVVMVSSATMHVNPVGAAASSSSPPQSVGDSIAAVLHAIVYSKTSIYMGIAVASMTLAALFAPVDWLHRLAHAAENRGGKHAVSVLLIGTIFLVTLQLLPFVPGLGRPVNGSHRWLYLRLPGIGELSIQPSEFAKWGVIAVLAWYGAARAWTMPSFRRGLIPGLLALGVVSASVVKEDLGTGLLIASAGCLVLIAAGARAWQFLAFVPFAAVGLVTAVVSNPYRLERLQTFLDPYADPRGDGYHMIQSMLAVSGGEGAGRGLGHGLLKFGYLPEDHNDFLFAIICEELGVMGAAAIAALFIGAMWAGLAIVRKSPSAVLRLIALGITMTLGLQALINQVVVTGLGPTKGIALPLVSSGGTGWILTATALGVLIAIDRHAHANAVSSTSLTGSLPATSAPLSPAVSA